MKVVYKHKATGRVLSQEWCKDNLDKQVTFKVQKPQQLSKLQEFEEKGYYVLRVPFSDDFETICVDDTFTLEELHELYSHVSYTSRHSDLAQKIVKVIDDYHRAKLNS